jgi:hypothetical protein
MFTGWLVGIDKKLKSQIFVGASVICWAIWLTRNNIVFDKVAAPSYLQAIFRGDLLDQVLVLTTERGGWTSGEDGVQNH